MNILNIAARLAVIAALSTGVASSAFAVTAVPTNQIGTGDVSGGAVLFSYTGGPGGTLATEGNVPIGMSGASGSSGPSAGAITFYFSPLTETSSSPNGLVDTFTSGGTPATFEIASNGADLLSGTFTGATITVPSLPATSATMASVGPVDYTGGQYITDYSSAHGTSAPYIGSFSWSFGTRDEITEDFGLPTSAFTPDSVSGPFNAFGANTLQTPFSVSPASVVPESNGSLLMLAALAPLALVGFMVRRKQARSL